VAVLRERTVWRRTRPPKLTDRPDELTVEEQANVRRAIRFLRRRFGTWEALATAMGIKTETLWQGAACRTRRPTAGFALRAARVAGVRVEDVLSGWWPRLKREPE
jgi:hypothetical protein